MTQELEVSWQRLGSQNDAGIPRPRLGTILLQSSSVTSDQVKDALSLQRQTGRGRVGDWLRCLGFITERDVTMALSRQYGLPWIKLEHFQPVLQVARMLPSAVARISRILPLGLDDHEEALRVAVTGPVDFQCHEAVRRMLRKRILPYIGDESAIHRLLDIWYPDEEGSRIGHAEFSSIEELRRILSDMVHEAVESRADNLEVELLGGFLWVRMDAAQGSEHRVFQRTLRPGDHGYLPPHLHLDAVPTGTG